MDLDAVIASAFDEHPKEHVIISRLRQLVLALQFVKERLVHLRVVVRGAAVVHVQIEANDTLVRLQDVQTGVV